MTDEIATADSGADTKPVENTNISVTDFANRRLGQMTTQNTEQESEPVAEEPTEETTEEVTEETQETETEETEVKSTSEDVLSQIDLDSASEEELKELAEKLGSKAVARFGELTARRKAAEERLAQLEAEIRNKPAPEPKKKIANNPFSNLETVEEIQAKTQEADDVIEWAEDLLFENADHAADDVIAEIEGKEMTKAQVRHSLLQARKARKSLLPDQLSKIQAKQKGINLKNALENQAKQELPWLDGEDNDIRKQYEVIMSDTRFKEMKRILSQEIPDVAGQLDYWFAHAANSMYGRKPIVEDKPSMKITPPKGATTSSANADKAQSRTAKSLKEMQNRFKQSGNAPDFAELRKLQMASRR